MTTIEIITALVAVYGAALSSYIFWGDRPKVKVTARMRKHLGDGNPHPQIFIDIEVLNDGGKLCRIEAVGIELAIPPLNAVSTPVRQVEKKYEDFLGSVILDSNGGKKAYEVQISNDNLARIPKPQGTAYVRLTTGKIKRAQFQTL